MPVTGALLLASGLARAKNARRAAAHTHVVATATTASTANLLLRNLSGRAERMLAPRWACTTLALWQSRGRLQRAAVATFWVRSSERSGH